MKNIALISNEIWRYEEVGKRRSLEIFGEKTIVWKKLGKFEANPNTKVNLNLRDTYMRDVRGWKNKMLNEMFHF